jgi:hypothetical protein
VKFLVQSTEKVKILGTLETLTNLLYQFTILTWILGSGLYLPFRASEKVAASKFTGEVAGTLAGEVARTMVGVVDFATS